MGSAVLTSSNAAWAWPDGITELTAEALGGAGAGGTATNNPANCGGGKGGSYAKKVITKTAATMNITVGGTAAASTIVQDGVTELSAAGGASVAANSATGASALVGSNIGDLTHAGGNGGDATGTTTLSGAGGGAAGPGGVGGAASAGTAGTPNNTAFSNGTDYTGVSGAGVVVRTAGEAGTNYGAAGSGGNTNQNTDRAGGAGAPGIVVLTWTRPNVDTLTDNFESTLDTAKWDTTITRAGDTAATTGGVLDLDTNSSTFLSHVAVRSDNLYNLIGSSVYVKLVRAGRLSSDTAWGLETVFELEMNGPVGNGASDRLTWLVGSDGWLVAWNIINNAVSTEHVQESGNYWTNEASYRWLRIREASGTYYWDTAPSTADDPPTEGQWVNRYSRTLAQLGADFSEVKVVLRTWYDNNSAAGIPIQSAQFDGLNIATTAGGGVASVADSGTYSQSGVATKADFAEKAEAASYSQTGQSATSQKLVPSVADPGGYTTEGVASSILRTYAESGDDGDYSQTGEAATGVIARLTVSEGQPGTYSYTGAEARVYIAGLSTGAPGTYEALGVAATSATSVLALGEPGTYTIEGESATGNLSLVSIADPSSYAYTGEAAVGLPEDIVEASSGLYQVTGDAAVGNLHHASVGEPGLYEVAGYLSDGVLTFGSNAEAGAYEQTGIVAEALKEVISPAESGEYAKTGANSDINSSLSYGAEDGDYLLEGFAGQASWDVRADLDSYSLVGAGTTTELTSGAQAGTYTLEGKATGFITDAKANHESIADPGSYLLTGNEALQDQAAEGGVRVITRTRRVVQRVVSEPVVNREAILNAERTGTSVVGLPGVPIPATPVERVSERVVERIVYRDRDVIVERTERVEAAERQVSELRQQLEAAKREAKNQFALGLAAGFVAGED